MYDNLKYGRGGSPCLERAGLAKGTGANTLLTAAPNGLTIDYAVDGLIYSKAEGDNIAMVSSGTGFGTVQANLTTCLYAVMLDAAGNYTIKKGVEVLTADLASGAKVLNWPPPDLARCAIGYFKLVLTAGATFTIGTTDLAAAGVAATFFNTFYPPTYPLLS